MVKDNTIYINGVIGQDYTKVDFLKDLQDALKDNPNSLNLAIDSLGGYCADADVMISKLQQLSIPIHTYNTGDVCSCASVLFMMGNVRTFDPSKGVFLAHNPYAAAEGDAEEMLKIVRELRSQEKKYESLYASATGNTIELISELMKENRPLTVEEISKYNFATEIVETTEMKAFCPTCAKYKIAALASHKLEETEQINKENKIKFKSMKTIMAKIIEAIKNLFLVTKDGVELQIDGDELNPGVKIYVEGVPASGSFELNDGTIITAVDGEVTEVQRVSVEQPEEKKDEKKDEEVVVVEEPIKEEVVEEKKEEIDNTVEELKTKIEELVEEVTMMKAQLKESDDKLKANEAIMSKIINMASSEKVASNEETKEEVKTVRFGFKK